MRISHVTSGLTRSAGGVREVVAALSSAQLKLKHEVSVVGLNSDWVWDDETWNGVPVHALSVRGPRALGYAPSMRSIVESQQPDLVHLHGLWMHPGRSTLQWHRKTDRPYIISIHGMLSEVALSYSLKRKAIVRGLFQNATFRHAAALHATSEEEEEEIRTYGLQNPIFRIPNGVTLVERPRNLPRETSKRILSLGRIHRKKALDRLITAWAQLEPNYPGWSLDIVGPDEDNESIRLKALTGSLGLQRVQIRGPLYGDEKISCMAGAAIFALPTLSENFALTVAESLMLGVPVVSTKGAPWRRLDSEGCGRWVEHGFEPMSLALRELMDLSDAERECMGQRGRLWMVREYSWESIADVFCNAYRSTIIHEKLR